ncbi:WSC-domain-containing protein [Xylariaceae sp. FL0804]|nr:WSC-domain-containing protein [Xylariaceae sp. FL0804]
MELPTRPRWCVAITILFALVQYAIGLASTDTITWGGDTSRTGYQPNHNMDPQRVGDASFGQLFRTTLPGIPNALAAEQVFSQPLVYTLSGTGKQYVYVLTTQNNLYQLDAKSGSIVNSRSLHIPFLTSDLDGCVDINPYVGVTGTGVIDPDTETLYFTAKTYKKGYTQGRLNGEYWFHAVDVNTLQERPGFPTSVEGTIFRNNPRRMLLSGNQLQRTGLLHVGQYIYAGFASHCVQYNFTGAIIGWDKTTGAVVESFATEGGPEPVDVKGGGVWMSGGGLSYSAGSIYFATGNGYASQLDNIPVPGRQPPSSLEEAAVNAVVNDDGTITPIDFFMPWEKKALDGGDLDLGTSPLQLLPPSTFSCPNAKRLGVVTGKSGKTYILNLDDLGGYQMRNNLDAVPQQWLNENSVYAGAGVMPLDGGYIYINVIRYQTHVWKFGCDGSGNVAFTHVADTKELNAYILGVGHGTTTSLNGQPGTGLVWTSDVEGLNLRIYKAVPDQNGVLEMINSFNVPGSMKFGRPVFGDGTCYVASNQGYIFGFGSPVNLPLNCTIPSDFGGSTMLNSKTLAGSNLTYQTITCQANVQTTVTGVNLTGNPNFVVKGVPSLPLPLQLGSSFNFQAAFAPQAVGPLSSTIQVNTTNAASGFAGNTPISLTGTGVSVAPILSTSPRVVTFPKVILGQQTGGTNLSLSFRNLGSSALHITGIQYSYSSENGPWITPNSSTASGTSFGSFIFNNLPSVIPAGGSQLTTVTFNPTTSGSFYAYLQVSSDGGTSLVDFFAWAGTAPGALIQFQSADGQSWVNYTSGVPFTFGDVREGTTVVRQLRLTNVGGDTAAPLSIAVSKPPFGVGGFVGAVNNVDLAEGTQLEAGESATASLYCAPPRAQVNTDPVNATAMWTLNTGDTSNGKQWIQFFCNAVAPQGGPLDGSGNGLYRYVGCAIENNPGRQLPTMAYSSDNSTNEMCISACAAKGFAFAGTQYSRECWCGPAPPVAFGNDPDCNFACTGSIDEICGGNGQFRTGGPHISTFADNNYFNPNLVTGPGNSTTTASTSSSSTSTTTTSMASPSSGSSTTQMSSAQPSSPSSTTASSAPPTSSSSTISSTSHSSSSLVTLPSTPGIGTTSPGPSTSSVPSGPSASSGTTTSSSPTVSSTMGSSTVGSSTMGSSTGASSTMGSSTGTPSTMGSSTGGSSTGGSSTMGSSTMGSSTMGSSMGGSSTMGSSTMGSSSAGSSTTSSPTAMTTSSTTTTTIMTTTSTTSTTSTSAAPTISGGGRALTAQSWADDSMTTEACARFCAAYAFFGTEYSRECYCGAALDPSSTLIVTPINPPPTTPACAMSCAGNRSETCGGPSRLSVYFSPDATKLMGAPRIVDGNANYTYYSCVQEPADGRALAGGVWRDPGMTVPLCLARAAAGGYRYAGVEYASECWTNATCSMTCAGSPLTYCGGPGLLDMYVTNATTM